MLGNINVVTSHVMDSTQCVGKKTVFRVVMSGIYTANTSHTTALSHGKRFMVF